MKYAIEALINAEKRILCKHDDLHSNFELMNDTFPENILLYDDFIHAETRFRSVRAQYPEYFIRIVTLENKIWSLYYKLSECNIMLFGHFTTTEIALEEFKKKFDLVNDKVEGIALQISNRNYRYAGNMQ